jgi:hypothetical protein
MRTRVKFEVTKVAELGYGGKLIVVNRLRERAGVREDGEPVSLKQYESTDIPLREISLTAVVGGTSPEESFAQYVPSGNITFLIDNPNLKDEFKPGSAYYVDFTPVEG